jgi:O-antigen ligase
LVFFILSQTRGAFIGLGAGIFVMFLYFAFAARGSLRKWSVALLAIGIILGGGIFAIRNSSVLNNIPAGRLLQISFSDATATAQTRFMVWGEAWKGFLERPILGWGPENFTTVFDKFFNPNFYVPNQGSETWYDRAHSVFFDYLSETGILGLLAYLGIFATFAWEFLKKEKRTAHEGMTTVLERGMILAVPVAYLVQGIAIFDVLPMYLCLFLFIAFASHFFAKQDHHTPSHEHHG